MDVAPAAQIVAFALFAFISVAGALGMTTTMSMFRSAIFLMASFIGVAGLFILLMADLLALLQVMMYIGGMLVMALFMVLFSGDPGGKMMTSMMELPAVEKFFSLGLAHSSDDRDHGDGEHTDHGGDQHEGHGDGHDDHGGHDQHRGHGDEESGNGAGHQHAEEDHSDQEQHDEAHDHEDAEESDEEEGGGEHDEHDHGGDHDHGDMDMEPMFNKSMKKPAAVLASLVFLLLSTLVLLRPAWPVTDALPAQNSAEQIGDLLMGKYMIAFEGAGLMILLGIFGAVYLSRPGRYPDPTDRDRIQAAVDETPAPIDEEPLQPLRELDEGSSDKHEDAA